MFHKRHHKTRRKKSRSHQRGLEKFLNSRLIIVLGVLFILIGLYYSLRTGEGTGNFSNVIRGFLSSSGSSSSNDASGMGSPMVLFYFLPAGLALIASLRYVPNYSNYTYPTAVICAIYLIIVQTKILMLNFINALWSYPDFFIAAIFLLVPPLLLSIHSLLHRKSTLLFLSLLYFYISIVAYSSFYGRFFEILFMLVLIFGVSIHWVAQKIEKPAINLVNFLFATGFFGLFWLRKFVVNAKPEFLPLFLIFGFLFYLLFAAIVLWSSTDKEHPMPKWMQSLLTGSNLLFYLGTTGYVIFKFFAFGYLWIFVGVLLLVHLAVFEGPKTQQNGGLAVPAPPIGPAARLICFTADAPPEYGIDFHGRTRCRIAGYMPNNTGTSFPSRVQWPLPC